jgi:hypothetical protein
MPWLAVVTGPPRLVRGGPHPHRLAILPSSTLLHFPMHLPTPEFSRLVTILALDSSTSSIDSMLLTWDHIAARYLRRHRSEASLADKIESIRLLAIHDAVIAILGPGAGFIFNGTSTGTTLAAALAATAQASHDILSNAFDTDADRIDLRELLTESLSLIANDLEKAVGAATGAASAAAFLEAFGSLAMVPPRRHQPAGPAAWAADSFRGATDHTPLHWARSA